MHPHKGPWADWYGCVPNPDRWAVIPIPDKHSARWFMPKRTPSLSVDEVMEVYDGWEIDRSAIMNSVLSARNDLRERLTKAAKP